MLLLINLIKMIFVIIIITISGISVIVIGKMVHKRFITLVGSTPSAAYDAYCPHTKLMSYNHHHHHRLSSKDAFLYLHRICGASGDHF